MTKDNRGLLQVKYHKRSFIGQVIEDFKKKEHNSSQTVRNYIMYLKGYELLKDTNISKQELLKICVSNFQFLSVQYEIAKINLHQEQLEMQKREPEFLVLKNIDDENHSSQNLKDETLESPSKDKSFLTSLLPK